MRKPNRMLVIAAAALAVAGGGGAAIAAAQGSSPSPTSFLDAVAKHLGISSEKLEDATKAAATDQVNAALEQGKITKQQADELKARIESGELPPLFGPGPFGGFHGHLHGPGDHLSAAADYLGLTVAQLQEKLADGQSLADVAEAQGKSVDGLEQAIIDEAEKQLDEAVADGTLTEDQAKALLARLRSHLDDLVNGTFPRPRGGRPFGPPPRGIPFWGTSA